MIAEEGTPRPPRPRMLTRVKYLRRILSAYVLKKKSGNLSFWHTDLWANRLEARDLRALRRYPMNFTSKTAYNGPRDEDGVIMLDYQADLGLQYNPNAVAQFALGHYDLYLDAEEAGDEAGMQAGAAAFLGQAAWFLRRGRRVAGGVVLWEYDFPFEMRERLERPWRSALAQGQALSVLLRAHRLTGREEYLERAREGFNAFRYDYREHEGGVICRQDGDVFLEEVMLGRPNHILNGWVWALWGVWEHALYTGDEYARGLFQASEATLARRLGRYDLGFWTRYDDNESCGGPTMPASAYYQRLHVVQMEGLHALTGREVYDDTRRRWQGYYDHPWGRRRALAWKIWFKVRHW
ncbi:MAG: D-glucuronyl C5-epimerase family protein [Thermodesulfobacteriota bacterium]